MLTMCGAMTSALSLNSLQLLSSSHVAFVADIFRSCLRTNSVIILGNLKEVFPGLLREIKFRNFEYFGTVVVVVLNFDAMVANVY